MQGVGVRFMQGPLSQGLTRDGVVIPPSMRLLEDDCGFARNCLRSVHTTHTRASFSLPHLWTVVIYQVTMVLVLCMQAR